MNDYGANSYTLRSHEDLYNPKFTISRQVPLTLYTRISGELHLVLVPFPAGIPFECGDWDTPLKAAGKILLSMQ